MALTLNEPFGSGHFYSHGLGHSYVMIEKRQVFLRSYQFSRKKSLHERIRRSLRRAKRLIWIRLRSARRLRSRLSCFRLGFTCRRRRFVRLLGSHSPSSDCFW